eukprot:TRINITY_DN4409_c0_g1_i2.p1 TRINITY_DN4409_c0_g1~~TRINITY_DN4409_c0_g1_i2.p1  ORF type:complete len:390 (+),score=76.40 TRINITY_DN4409_c0_g1_i2:139-1308(+)
MRWCHGFGLSSLVLVLFLLGAVPQLQYGEASEAPEPSRNRTEHYFDFRAASTWTVDETITWLEEELGSSAYSDAFRQEKIDGELLLELEDGTLKEVFNISKAYQRKKVMRAIAKMKQHATPVDTRSFWVYRSLNFSKANVLFVSLIHIPRLTILYEYLFSPEDFEAVVGQSDPSWQFWITWIFAPSTLCAYYALPFWYDNFFVATLFVYGCMYYQMIEIRSLFAYDAERLDSTISWKRSVVAPLSAIAFNYVSKWAGALHFWIYFITDVIFCCVALHKFIKRELGKRNQLKPPEDTVFPPALEIETKDLDADSVPQHFLCPITRCIMTQPAITDHGNTYELSAIREWLKKNQKDPLTNKPLNVVELKPNRIVQSMIEDWIQQRNEKQTE